MIRTEKISATTTAVAGYTVGVVTASTHALPALARRLEGWEELARFVSAHFAAPAWAVAAHRHLGRGEPLIVVVHSGAKLVGLLPLAVQRRFGRPVLGFLGAGPSDYGTALLDPELGEDRSRVLDALLDTACEQVAGGLLDLEQVSDADPVLELVLTWAEQRRRPVRKLVQAGTLQEVFTTVDGRPVPPKTRSIRRHRQRTLRLLRARGTVEVSADLLPEGTPPEDVLRVADECRAVDEGHPSGERRTRPWQGRSGELLRSFLLEAPHQSRWLTGVRLDGRLVAYSLDLVAPTSVATYFSSYHQDVADCGVGTYLESLSRIRAAESGASQIDFLRGLQPYKRRAATTEHVSYRLQVGGAPGRWSVQDRVVALLLGWRQELRKHERLVAVGRRTVQAGSGTAQRLRATSRSLSRARSRASRTAA